MIGQTFLAPPPRTLYVLVWGGMALVAVFCALILLSSTDGPRRPHPGAPVPVATPAPSSSSQARLYVPVRPSWMNP